MAPDDNPRRQKAVHFGDENFHIEESDDLLDVYHNASCNEVIEACCVHTKEEWGWWLVAVFVLLFSFYWMVFGINLLGESAKIMTGCAAGSLLGSKQNPLTAMMTGVLATVLLQSSGTTTGVVVSLTEASIIDVETGIYIVMGANIGTTVTCLIVSLAQMGDADTLERGFAAAAVHGMFNYFTILVLFPFELMTGSLGKLTQTIAESAQTDKGEKYEGPMKKFVSPLIKRLIISNQSLIQKVAKGASCDAFYPVRCDPLLEPSYKTCDSGLIGCDKKTGDCPLFFREGASDTDDKLAGFACFVISLLLLLVSLIALIWALNKLLFGMSTRVVHTLTTCNGYIEFLFGVGITMLAQSSSIVTSAIVPFAGAGVLRLEQIYPLVLGSNLGTALNSTLSAIHAIGTDPLQVALAHVFINLTGFLIYYPLPPLRLLPFTAARNLSRNAKRWKWFPMCYLVMMFAVFPMLLFGLGTLYLLDTNATRGTAILLTVVLSVGVLGLWYWCRWEGGREKYHAYIEDLNKRTKGSSSDESYSQPDEEENSEASEESEPSI